MEDPNDVEVLLAGLEVGSISELRRLVAAGREGVVVTPHQARAIAESRVISGFTLTLDGDPAEVRRLLSAVWDEMAAVERDAQVRRVRLEDGVGRPLPGRPLAMRTSSLHGTFETRQPIPPTPGGD